MGEDVCFVAIIDVDVTTLSFSFVKGLATEQMLSSALLSTVRLGPCFLVPAVRRVYRQRSRYF